MSTLTQKQATAQLANKGDNCLFWMPFNEAASPFVDLVDGDFSMADASATFATPHAPAIGFASAAVGTGSLATIKAGKAILFLFGTQIATSAAFQANRIGTAAVCRLDLVLGSPRVEDDDGTEKLGTAISSAGAGENVFAGVLADTSDGKVYTYESVNDAAASLKGSVTDGPTGSFTIARYLTVGNTGTRQPQYGQALFAFDSKPSDTLLIAALQEAHDLWSRGRKLLPPSLTAIAYTP